MTYSIHPNTKLGEVKLRVSNLERSLLFYENIVGLKVLSRSRENSVALTADGVSPLVILERSRMRNRLLQEAMQGYTIMPFCCQIVLR
ncbi:hypothetical protein [Paenibacillus sp. Marseille-Q4541]|uniref:hypothetical protein n=1 Tax=Paenibacillus sp. Marseille-Q4541 TaxID=2831522 RepID=UPI002018475F|nr:hypothetical protein [Paenibacillus sp. Marseille-Q4541]